MSSGVTTTIAVVGGPLVAGHGDGRGLGWVLASYALVMTARAVTLGLRARGDRWVRVGA